MNKNAADQTDLMCSVRTTVRFSCVKKSHNFPINIVNIRVNVLNRFS